VAADRNYDDVAAFTRTGAAGEVIFLEDDKSTELYVVQDGRIELVRGPEAAVVGVAEAGDIFGEWSFFERQPRDFTARALTDFKVIRLDQDAFDRISAEAPEVTAWMLRKLARRLHERLPSGRPAAAVRAPAAAAPAAPAPSAAPPAGDAILVEESSGTKFTLSEPETLIGRVDRSTGHQPEVDLTPLDTERTLSRRHAKIVRREAAYFVREDTASRNGTFVNSRRLTAGHEVELHDGDEVRFGLVKTIFRWR
jgi:hypothetical protein